MRVGFIVVLYKTPESEVNRINKEILDLGFEDFEIFFIDNTKNNRGYAAGVNVGIRQAQLNGCQLLIVTNPDISFKKLKAKDILSAAKHFDIWGLTMRMHGVTYYGGEIDKLRLSGGLLRVKPRERFFKSDFVSGSLMLIKKKVVDKIGLFDEQFFMYYEDVDYCLRARREGFRVGIDSKITYTHFEVSRTNKKKELFLSQAHHKFFDKHANFCQKVYKRIKNPGFILNFTSLNLSSLFNKLLNFVLFIFLVRFLSPSEYGVYALVWTQVSLFSPIVDLGTTSYGIIHLPVEKGEKFVELYNLRFFVSLLVFLLTVFTGFFLFRSDVRIFSFITLTSFVIFSNMLSGSYLIQNALKSRLYNSALVSVVFNLILISTLISGLYLSRSLALIFLMIFVFYNLYSLLNYILIKHNFVKLKFEINFKAWKNLLQKTYVYVLIGFFSGLYFRVDVYLLKLLKSESEVGIYSAGFKFFEALLFIAASYNIARTPILARLIKVRRSEFIKTVKKDLIFLAFLGFTIAIITWWLSPLVLPLFLQGKYLSGVAVIRIVIFALPLILLSSVFINAIYVMQRAYIILIIFLLQVFINLGLNFIFIPRFSFIASSYITVISEGVNFIALLLVFIYFFQKLLKSY